eukprot:TRINITY_DN1357_c0_g1_i11.p1 TRINITY_DN1357_c0_g1~~TRINITY_DN1357_c0_g1_i11.p1  ORF type:complete len:247 (-),score=89.55 TRINITY_DN1357_c0_g1_i11:137-877(-)
MSSRPSTARSTKSTTSNYSSYSTFSTSSKSSNSSNSSTSSTSSVLSTDTQKLLNSMISKNSKLSNKAKKELLSMANEGGTLPKNTQQLRSSSLSSTKTTKKKKKKKTPQLGRGKKTVTQIQNSGAFEIEVVKPKAGVDREAEKAKLAKLMEFESKEALEEQERLQKEKQERLERMKENVMSKYDGKSADQIRFDELVQEVEERKQFLADMEALGQKQKYENIIKGEIAEKVREMKDLDKKMKSRSK